MESPENNYYKPKFIRKGNAESPPPALSKGKEIDYTEIYGPDGKLIKRPDQRGENVDKKI